MLYLLDRPGLLFVATCVVLLIAHEAGYRLRALAAHRDEKDWLKEVHDTRNQIALLLSLLLGFAMAMSLSRFDERKKLTADEAGAIGTAYMRAAMQPEPVHSKTPPLLREYVDARMAVFGNGATSAESQQAADRSRQIQDELWSDAVTAAQQSPTPISALYVQSLNNVFDVDGERIEWVHNRVPVDIWTLLGVLAVMTSVVIGYGQRHRSWMATFVPVLMVAIAVSLIADLDTPTSGFIQINQQSLKNLAAEMDMHLPASDDAH
jgi:hypothetical protein